MKDTPATARGKAVLEALRPILSRCGLAEETKWAKPCFTHEGRNIAIVQEMKDFVALMFFKGALLADPDGVLEQQGPNSRSARRIRFTSAGDVDRLAAAVEGCVAEAIRVEDTGLELGPPEDLELVEELRQRLDADPALRKAFESLTPGRQREYHLHISGAKRAETRTQRVERCAGRILAGKGLRDR